MLFIVGLAVFDCLWFVLVWLVCGWIGCVVGLRGVFVILLRILVKVTCVVGLYYLFIWLWCYGGWFGFCVWVCGLVQLVGL